MPRPRLESASWWPQLLADKDAMSLRELAEKYNVSINGLSRALKRAGVSRRPIRTIRASAATSSAAPDPRSVEARDWWSEFLSLKDAHSLSALAERFGVAEITLQRAMKRTGVTRRSQRGAKGNRQAADAAEKLAAHQDLVGVLADAEVAVRAGVSRYAVAQYRRRRGIGAQHLAPRSTGRGTPSTPTARVAATGAEAYLVTVHGASDKFVVVASDLASAAAQAQEGVRRHFKTSSRIEGLEFIGHAL